MSEIFIKKDAHSGGTNLMTMVDRLFLTMLLKNRKTTVDGLRYEMLKVSKYTFN